MMRQASHEAARNVGRKKYKTKVLEIYRNEK